MKTFQIVDQAEKIKGLLDATGRVSTDDELRSAFKEYSLSYVGTNVASLPDPLGEDYARMALDLCSSVAQREYEPSKTGLTKFDTTRIYNMFPLVTKSPATTGAYFHLLGETVGLFTGLKPSASILEFGPGWEETILALARLGFEVTCIDINPDFIELIRRKAEVISLENLRCLVADFSAINTLDQKFDAILFFKCFHHCIDHVSLLENCCSHLDPGDRLIFLAEPIMADFPVPWGLRPDGQSLWSTVLHGWLELGFQQHYFEGLLRHNRLLFKRATMANFSFFSTYVSCRVQRLSPATAPFGSLVGRPDGDTILLTCRQGVLVYGLYLPLQKGGYQLRCVYELHRRVNDAAEQATLRICHDTSNTVILSTVIPDGNQFEILFQLGEDINDFELVIEVCSQTSFCFKHFDQEYE